MKEFDIQHKNLIKRIIDEGVDVEDRTGTGCRMVFDADIRIDLSKHYDDGFYQLPIMSLRKTFPRTAFMELLWMLSGSTDVNMLKHVGVGIWDANSSREFLDSRGLHDLPVGDIGKGYGYQMRSFNGKTDQILKLIEGIKQNPNGRRHVVSLWNPSELDETALPPCHHFYNFMVEGDMIHLKFSQRSSDQVLAGNMNILFASFFLILVANETGYKAGKVVQSITNAHIYHNLMDAASEIVKRDPIDMTWDWSTNRMSLTMDDVNDFSLSPQLTDYTWNEEFFSLNNTENMKKVHPPIPREMMQISA